MWTTQQQHKKEFTGLVVGDINGHLFFLACDEAGPQTTPMLPVVATNRSASAASRARYRLAATTTATGSPA